MTRPMFLMLSVHSAADEKLGFEAAVTALGLKANISEAEHPLLCESIRRQRGELAIAMLVHYKDDIVKLSKVRQPFSHFSAGHFLLFCSRSWTCSPSDHGHVHQHIMYRLLTI